MGNSSLKLQPKIAPFMKTLLAEGRKLKSEFKVLHFHTNSNNTLCLKCYIYSICLNMLKE